MSVVIVDEQTPCTTDDPELWFSENPREIAEAKAKCLGCPALTACRAGGKDEEFGVWGGMDNNDRREARRAQKDAGRAATLATILQLNTEGHSLRAIAATVGVSKSTVSNVIQSSTSAARRNELHHRTITRSLPSVTSSQCALSHT